MHIIFLFYLTIAIIAPTYSWAQTALSDRISAISGNFVFTGESGNTYRLADIIMQEKDASTLNFLTETLLDKEVYIEIFENSMDRYGNNHVYIYDAKNNWVNAMLVSAGLAQLSGAMTTPDKFQHLRAMEIGARKEASGFWKSDQYQIFQTTPYNGPLNAFVIAEGTVFQVNRVKQQIYLNFTDDWLQDFSVGIEKPLWKKFSALGIDLTNLAGQKIQIRGWIRNYNGPFLEIIQTGQLIVE